ncbi:CPBP family intramembrane glutamic endopeptidase [Brevibacterium oceani]|uniref:CPBP family intramembrane glutamic endopeptidase n=1 Tax=Brevibacterium oceani TaxID=358099 RepID=UPI0015E75977|nr:CPBP family intramembrane glutamic endopeptidase [Brevibacterium oceani]
MIAAAGGVLATVLKIPATMAFTALFGETASTQDSWSSAAQGGIVAVAASFLFLGILTPIAEEMFFRGVITTVLLRYGSIVGVLGSTVVFALLHGEPILMVSAVLVGLPAGELRRRTGSIWPGVALHIVFDLLSSIGLFILLPLLGG